MKKQSLRGIALAALVSGGALIAFADHNLVITGKNGDETKYEVGKVDKITFRGSKMIVTHTKGIDELTVADIAKMKFDYFNSLDEVLDVQAAETLLLNINGGVLTATETEGGHLTMTLWDMQGRRLAYEEADGSLTYSLLDLPGGVYIIRVNDKTIKFQR